MRRTNPVALAPLGGLCLAFSTALPAVGQDGGARFAEVLARNPPAEDVACSYITTTTDSEQPDETRTERHEAGAAASDVDEGGNVANFDSVVVDLREFAALDMRLSAEDADTVSFDFSPPPEEASPEETSPEAAMAEKLRGTLVVGKPDLRPQRLVIALAEPFWPVPVARVKELRFETTFAVDPATDAVVPALMETTIRGRAFFKRFEQEERVVYSDFDCRRTTARADDPVAQDGGQAQPEPAAERPPI